MSLNSVQEGLRLLAEQGVVSLRPRQGCFVRQQPGGVGRAGEVNHQVGVIWGVGHEAEHEDWAARIKQAFEHALFKAGFHVTRVWDAESLIAYNRVIRAIAPVEEVIVEGELVGDAAQVQGEGRVSGVQRGDEMLLLVADYYGRDDDATISLKLNLPASATITDLLDPTAGAMELEAGVREISIPLNGARARLLHVQPAE